MRLLPRRRQQPTTASHLNGRGFVHEPEKDTGAAVADLQRRLTKAGYPL